MPTRRFAARAAVMLLAIGVAAAGVIAAQREVRERRVIVSVTNRDGTPELALSPREFIVRENGVSREVISASPAPPPTHIVMLVDDGQAIDGKIVDVRNALVGFIRAMTGSGTPPSMSLVTFGDRPTTVVNFTTDAAAVQTAVERIFPRVGAGARFLDAIIETAGSLKNRQAERPVIVAFVAEAGEEFSDVTHARVDAVLRDINVPLWPVVLQNGSASENSSAGRERAIVLSDSARASGGHSEFVLSEQMLPRAFSRLAARLQSCYEVVYGRPESLVAPTRFELTMRNPGLEATAPIWAAP